MKWTKILTKKLLNRKYILLQKSSYDIAEEIGCSYNTVITYLRYFDIPIRSIQENRKIFHIKNPNFYVGKNNPMFGRIGQLNPAYKNGLPKCLDCDKELSDYKSIRCKSCDGIFKTIHGLSYLPYTSDFCKKVRFEILERDNFICQYCSMTKEQHLKLYNRQIEVHHINYNKIDSNHSNLITLCKKCNIRANFNRDYWYAYYTYIIENYIKENK